MRKFKINIPSESIVPQLQNAIDQKTKPLGSLGRVEEIALQCGYIQQTLTPVIRNPHIIVFAGDHGIASTGLVNPYPQEVTRQMVQNFLNGGAAINVLCRANNISLKVVNCGVCLGTVWTDNYNLLIERPIAAGTANYLETAAMTNEQLTLAIDAGAEIVSDLSHRGCNTIGFGEMGIGNTSSASLIMHALTGLPLETCVGKGTGANEPFLVQKTETLKRAAQFHKLEELQNSPAEVLQRVGGFEIAMMCGAFLAAAENKMLFIVDGFIATAAFLVAQRLYPESARFAVFAHCSAEKGHELMLKQLDGVPLLGLNMRLGEGTGVALAIPLIRSAVAILNEMASFSSAGVSTAG